MTIEEQTAFFKRMTNEMSDVMLKKGNDYANADRLSNFKLAGNICGLSAEKNCLSLIATKVARLGVLIDGDEPSNEAMMDSVLDLANYSLLLGMLLEEKKGKCCGKWDEFGNCTCKF